MLWASQRSPNAPNAPNARLNDRPELVPRRVCWDSHGLPCIPGRLWNSGDSHVEGVPTLPTLTGAIAGSVRGCPVALGVPLRSVALPNATRDQGVKSVPTSNGTIAGAICGCPLLLVRPICTPTTRRSAPGRKVGHVTYVADNQQAVEQQASVIGALCR